MAKLREWIKAGFILTGFSYKSSDDRKPGILPVDKHLRLCGESFCRKMDKPVSLFYAPSYSPFNGVS